MKTNQVYYTQGGGDVDPTIQEAYQYHTQKILAMLQEGATVDEVSEYILLNKK